MKSFLVFFLIFIGITTFGQKRVYPMTITLSNGNVSYCKNATATALTLSFTTQQCGSGGSLNVTHTEKLFVNTVNSTSGGIEVATLSNTSFTTNATYTPPTTSSGTFYYYAIVQWNTDACAIGNTITSSVVSVIVIEPNSTIPFTQGFNNNSCGWTTQQVSGTVGAITMTTSSTNETTNPYEGTHFVQFNSFSISAGNSTRYQSPNISVGTNENIEIKFHWRNSTSSSYASNLDRVIVQWYDGTTWIDIQTYNRPDATLNGWQEKTCQFNTGNKTTIKIGFRFISAYGYNIALDNLIVSKIVPLPVDLLYFEGVKYPTFNSLKWATASEYNSSHFDIERSTNGDIWEVIGGKVASGNSQSKVNYYYLDNYVNQYNVYYRLIQFDVDGKFKIYGPIIIQGNSSNKKIVKYINLLGQEVDENYKGIIFEVYEDGSMKKILR